MTHEEMLRTFIYEPDTGLLRKVRNARKPYPWRPIGTDGKYLATTMPDGTTMYLHQAVWFYHHGVVPSMVDHKNRDTRDCRIENLRACSPAQNQFNSARKHNNRAGAKGVVFHKACKSRPWQAKIAHGGKVHSLGYFATVAEASAAYAEGAKRVAGEFARAD